PYTADRLANGPDLELVRRLAQTLSVPIFCEGRVHSPEQARAALDAGAFAVVVGTAITAIDWVTRRCVATMQASASRTVETLAAFVKQRAERSFHNLQKQTEGLPPEEALRDRRPDWPGHRWGIGQDGSIAGMIYHVTAWKQMTLPLLEP